MNREKTLKQRLLLWLNRARFDIQIRKRGRFPQLIIHERFKYIARGIKTLLTVIGLLTAFYSFQSLLVGFLVGIAIYFLTTFIESLIFSYNSLYVHSLPDFEIVPSKWLGAFFGYAEHPGNPVQIPIVGWIMSDAEYAKKVHALLLRWSYGDLKDEQKDIRASVILDGAEEYVFFCYPNIDRRTAAQFYEGIETSRRQTSLTDVHHKMFVMLTFGKRCRITANSYLPTFRERYTDGIPYLFRLAVQDADGVPREVEGLQDFIFSSLKIKERSELNRKDIEYDLLRILG